MAAMPAVEAAAWLALIRTGVGSAALRAASERFGSASALLAAGPAGWRAADIEVALPGTQPQLIASDARWLAVDTHHVIGWTDPDYPRLLRQIASPPPCLFVVGAPEALWQPQIAIVGARACTAGGADNARVFATAFAKAGLTVTSGLAFGIDAAAHQGALDAGGDSIAVVGTGPDRVYPAQHRDLARRIAEHGAMVSEFPPGTGARREHFPSRNRIIAGLTLGTLVVEAGERSGALITARHAADAGREVFAVPGSIHNPCARGCHRLIRQGAGLVESAAEVIEALAPLAGELAAALRDRLAEAQPTSMSATDAAVPEDREHARLLAALGHDPVGIDLLAERTGLTVAAVSSMLLIMEMEGWVRVEHGLCTRCR